MAKLPSLRIGQWCVAIDLAHFVFVAGISSWIAWYGFDAYSAGADIQNLSLIAPCVALALVLALSVLAGCVSVSRAVPPDCARVPLTADFRRRILGTMALLALYVATAPFAGFDVATFAYILATLAFLGERRPLVLLLLPAGFCAIAIYGFDTVLATPLPLLLWADPN